MKEEKSIALLSFVLSFGYSKCKFMHQQEILVVVIVVLVLVVEVVVAQVLVEISKDFYVAIQKTLAFIL